jgi:hypothetical protein
VRTIPDWQVIGGLHGQARGILATGTIVGRGSKAPTVHGPTEVQSAEGNGTFDSIPLMLPADLFRSSGSEFSLVLPRVDIGDQLSPYSYVGEITGLDLPPGTWYSPNGTVSVAGPTVLSRYRANTVELGGFSPVRPRDLAFYAGLVARGTPGNR